MAVKKYQKNTSYIKPPETDEPCEQTTPASSGVNTSCGCIPGMPNFTDTFTLVNSVNGMTGDVVLDMDTTFIHEQMSASDVWTITHFLGRYPSVTVVDSAGSVVVGDVQYISKDQIILTFQGAFSGTAYLN